MSHLGQICTAILTQSQTAFFQPRGNNFVAKQPAVSLAAMANGKLRIAIIGCGTAGPAAAILLARQGHEIVLFERAPVCEPVGAGFLLQPSGMAVLEEIGISEQVLSHAARVDCLHVVDAAGRMLLDLRYGELRHGGCGAGLHRPVLLHYLIEAMRAEGVETRWGCEIAEAVPIQGGWSLESADGTACGAFDLLIVADGARSKFRDLLGTGGINRGYPWGAHWFIGKNDGVFPENELYQVVDGTRRLGGFLATGRDLGGKDPLGSLFWSIKIEDDAAWRERPLEEWKQEILNLCPRAEGLLEQITRWDQVLTARYGDVRMRCWHGERIVVLGDAAHAMSPQLGQGVNLALADASCLAECLAAHSVAEALVKYQRRRRVALQYYQFATRCLTPWFQSDYEWLTRWRTLFFTVAQNVPPMRRFMTFTMAGLVGDRNCQKVAIPKPSA